MPPRNNMNAAKTVKANPAKKETPAKKKAVAAPKKAAVPKQQKEDRAYVNKLLGPPPKQETNTEEQNKLIDKIIKKAHRTAFKNAPRWLGYTLHELERERTPQSELNALSAMPDKNKFYHNEQNFRIRAKKECEANGLRYNPTDNPLITIPLNPSSDLVGVNNVIRLRDLPLNESILRDKEYHDKSARKFGLDPEVYYLDSERLAEMLGITPNDLGSSRDLRPYIIKRVAQYNEDQKNKESLTTLAKLLEKNKSKRSAETSYRDKYEPSVALIHEELDAI